MQIKSNHYDIDHVYKDLDLGLTVNPMTGNIKELRGLKAVTSSVRNLVMMEKWDVPFEPNIYGGISNALFEHASPITFAHIQDTISGMLRLYEPRIRLDNENGVSVVLTSNEVITITIKYRVVEINHEVTTTIKLKRSR